MKKSIIVTSVTVAISFAIALLATAASAADQKAPPSELSKEHHDRIVTVADYKNFTDCINGVGAKNMREIAQSRLNPNHLTISNANVPATGVLRKDGNPTTCVATQLVVKG